MKKIVNEIFNKNYPPKIVAEISANHNGSIKSAKKLILTAKKYGADLVKLQTYEPRNMTINSNKNDFLIRDGLWKGHKLWELYKKAQTPLKWQKELFEYAKKINIPCFSTPYDDEGVNLLKKLKCGIFKISSFEMNDLTLVEKICKIGKPVIISTGLANLDEIKEVYKIAIKSGCKKLILLYCVSSYPAKNEDFNLNNIEIFKKQFNCTVGFSDHSKDNSVAMIAVAKGARIIEKHLALDNQKKGLDLEFSIKGKELLKFKKDVLKSWSLQGKTEFFRTRNELKNKKFQRSIYAISNIKVGDVFSSKNVKRIRPGYGLHPSKWKKILKRKSKNTYTFGSRIKDNELI